ncbi:uncharacterized protein LOC143920167 isoform X2 [Arctopsyche grandis]|uniref:uncharacterized protein LOC143920167 isoform X2 n=1 Tax=Arctopsyche grandis TaxID=121162 RepID=UPI00406D8DDB
MDLISLLENDEWPSNSDDLLDNFFGLDGGIFDLAASDDLNLLAVNEQENNTASSLAGSDSGLSMDHADFDMIDHQLSPLMMHRTLPDDDILNSSFTSSVHLKNSINSTISHSPPPSVSPSHSSTSSSDIGSPVECYEDKIDIGSCQNNVVKDTQPVQTFQNTINLKRKSSTPTSAAVVLPKIQKHYISKHDSSTIKNIAAARHDKQRIIIGNQSSHIPTVQSTDVSSTQKKIIRVAPIAGNPRSILLPVTIKDMKDFRSIKIINATDLKNPTNIKIAAANFLQKSKQAMERKKNNLVYATFDSDDQQYIMDDSTSERGSIHSDDDDDDRMGDEEVQMNRKTGQFPRLELTNEERRLLVKEGISLPSSYPLTRLEERELKRIRRKIRNKISAQDSRRRKKEYVDGLEDRVKQCTEENQSLMKKIKALQSQNQSLATQLKKLQNIVTKGSGYKSTQPATCLMVLLLSVALVMAPSLRTGNSPSQVRSAVTSPSHVPHNALINSIRRALLSAHTLTPPISSGVISLDESADEIVNVEDVSVFGQPLSDHNYPLMECPIPTPGGRYTTPGYMDIPIDDGGTSPNRGFLSMSKNYPVKLEKLEYDEYDENEMLLSHHEEVEEIIIDNKDFKDDTIKLYDAAMEKLEILENSNRFAHISGKLTELLDLGSQTLHVHPNTFEISKNKTFTGVKNVVIANMELQ